MAIIWSFTITNLHRDRFVWNTLKVKSQPWYHYGLYWTLLWYEKQHLLYIVQIKRTWRHTIFNLHNLLRTHSIPGKTYIGQQLCVSMFSHKRDPKHLCGVISFKTTEFDGVCSSIPHLHGSPTYKAIYIFKKTLKKDKQSYLCFLSLLGCLFVCLFFVVFCTFC